MYPEGMPAPIYCYGLPVRVLTDDERLPASQPFPRDISFIGLSALL